MVQVDFQQPQDDLCAVGPYISNSRAHGKKSLPCLPGLAERPNRDVFVEVQLWVQKPARGPKL
jgi:hypothetical protein